jgi:hypothetical protein
MIVSDLPRETGGGERRLRFEDEDDEDVKFELPL